MQSVIRYKLTDRGGKTHGNTEWGPGKSYTTSGERDLCGPGWLHCYSDPVLAILLNPIHANFGPGLKLCEVECSGQSRQDRGLKEGWTTMTFKRWLSVPEVTTTQRVAFGILCAKQVYSEASWLTWANKWLANEDRTVTAAAAAANAAYANAVAAPADAAAAVAYNAADAAAYAAADAADAAAYAAAADAAVTIAYATDIDLVAIAHQALEYK